MKCLNIENIDSIFKKCVHLICDCQCFYDDIFFALYCVKCLILIDFVDENILSDSRENNYNSDVVCCRQDNDEIKC